MSDQRTLPAVDDENRFFWTSGADGVLRILHCGDCGHWQHPPQPRCSRCFAANLTPEPVCGKATVWNFTINSRVWSPRLAEPFAIAIVELPEQPSLRMTTRLIDVDPQDVHIGMPVEVVFEQDEDVWLPLFRPASA